MKLRIESDGTPAGTHVYVVSRAGVEDELENVMQCSWSVDTNTGRAVAQLVVNAADMEVELETEQVRFVMDHEPGPTVAHQFPDVPEVLMPQDAYAEYLRNREPPHAD